MEKIVIMPADELQTLLMDSMTAVLNITPASPDHPLSAKPVTRRELCEHFGVTEPTIIRWERRGKIPSMRIGSAVRYDLNAVTRALEGKKKGGSR